MNGLNRVTLLGNLAADPELKQTSSGTSVLKLRVACNERYKDRNEQWQERTEFVSVVVWGKRGESLHKYVEKGGAVLVEGSIRTTSWDRDGTKVYKTEVVASNVILVGPRNGGNRQDDAEPPRDAQRRPPRQAPAPVDDDGPPPDLDDPDSLPF
ncbi:MAG: single-stranded DNA-binding protein [Candidatus Omnitrophota bacterium]